MTVNNNVSPQANIGWFVCAIFFPVRPLRFQIESLFLCPSGIFRLYLFIILSERWLKLYVVNARFHSATVLLSQLAVTEGSTVNDWKTLKLPR